MNREIITGRKFSFPYPFNIYMGKNSIFQFGNNLTVSNSLLNPTCIHPSKFIIGSNAKLTVGNNVGMSGVSIGCLNSINIGNNCVIGGGVKIWDSDFHSLNFIDRRKDEGNIISKPINIEEDVFIGASTIILKGVKIGARSIIGAGSVVTSEIPSDQIWAGVPAKLIKPLNFER